MFAAMPLGRLVRAGTTLYWAVSNGIMDVSVDGGIPGQPVTENGHSPRGLAVDGTNLYWADTIGGTSGSIQSFPLAGGTSTVLVSLPEQLIGVAVDATSIYFTSTAGNVRRVAKP
jgi:hypothetical protein